MNGIFPKLTRRKYIPYNINGIEERFCQCLWQFYFVIIDLIVRNVDKIMNIHIDFGW